MRRNPRRLLARGTPWVYEYRIERDPAGNARRDADGRPIVAFGPAQHADPEEWRKIQLYWGMLRAADRVVGFKPLF